jgi:hypothetical protein
MTNNSLAEKLNEKFGDLSHAKIYEIMRHINDNPLVPETTSVNGVLTRQPDANTVPGLGRIADNDQLRFIFETSHYIACPPNKTICPDNMEQSPWQITITGHWFMTVYEFIA